MSRALLIGVHVRRVDDLARLLGSLLLTERLLQTDR